MNAFWWILIVLCVLYGVASGNGSAMSDALLASGGDAVALGLSLAGAYMLWCGLMEVMQRSGLVAALSRIIKPVFRLFPGVRPESQAGQAIATNLAANMLGLGNAATPAGIEAVQHMRELHPHGDTPSDAICMFLVINASSVQLIPTTVISMRAAAGAANPADIILPALIATACSTLFAIVAMRVLLSLRGKEGLPHAGNAPRRRDTAAGGRRAAPWSAARRRGL